MFVYFFTYIENWVCFTYLFFRQYSAMNFNENVVKKVYVPLAPFFASRMMLHLVIPKMIF